MADDLKFPEHHGDPLQRLVNDGEAYGREQRTATGLLRELWVWVARNDMNRVPANLAGRVLAFLDLRETESRKPTNGATDDKASGA